MPPSQTSGTAEAGLLMYAPAILDTVPAITGPKIGSASLSPG